MKDLHRKHDDITSTCCCW